MGSFRLLTTLLIPACQTQGASRTHHRPLRPWPSWNVGAAGDKGQEALICEKNSQRGVWGGGEGGRLGRSLAPSPKPGSLTL